MQQESNYWRLEGRLADDPVKKFDENGRLFVELPLISQVGKNKYVFKTLVYGSKSDAIGTIYAKHDKVFVEGVLGQISGIVVLYITSHSLVEKGNRANITTPVSQFRKLIKAYSPQEVIRREKQYGDVEDTKT